jgi:hypothetical protein
VGNDYSRTPDNVRRIGWYGEQDKNYGHDSGWAEGVLDKISKEESLNTPTNLDIVTVPTDDKYPYFDESKYSADEMGVYDAFHNTVLNDANWKTYVDKAESDPSKVVDYKDSPGGVGAPEQPGGYDSNNQQNHTFAPPDVKTYNGESLGNSPVSFSSDAVKHFTEQLSLVVEKNGQPGGIIVQAYEQLGKVDLKPGAFAQAQILRNKANALKDDATHYLSAVQNAVSELRDSLVAMSKEYDSTEEINKMTGEQLNQALGKFSRDIDDFKNLSKG